MLGGLARIMLLLPAMSHLSPSQRRWRLRLTFGLFMLALGVVVACSVLVSKGQMTWMCFAGIHGMLCSISLIWLSAITSRSAPQRTQVRALSKEKAQELEEVMRRQFEKVYPASAALGASGDEEIPVAEPVCVVCLEEKASGQLCRMLRCGHDFHAECIDSWWLSRASSELACPTCRQTHAVVCEAR
mmetsp:Transcript_45788/g.115404  ORF Transcript_45788/g.115404 Transcript_45788/m.115404 type:complete len:187 (-) Transcript_45788:85-645(-)